MYAFLCASMHNLNKGNNWLVLFFIANYDVNMEYDYDHLCYILNYTYNLH